MDVPHIDCIDTHAQVKALIDHRRITVPKKFDESALADARARANAGDALLAASLQRAVDGCITQDLAGGPELISRYRTARPAAMAVLQAAMDARRLGVGVHLPLDFLQQAAESYLTEAESNRIGDDWFEHAMGELARPVRGDHAPLRQIRPRRPERAAGAPPPATTLDHHVPACRLAEYLDEFGYHERGPACPPDSFWQAAYDHISDPDELTQLAHAALCRYRLSWAFHLARLSGVCSPAGDNVQASVMRMREAAGDHHKVTELVRREADKGGIWALLWLAARGENAGEQHNAEEFLRRAASAGHVGALVRLLALCEKSGETREVELLTRQAVAATGREAGLLPSMYLRSESDCISGFVRCGLISSTASYIWIQAHGESGWIFSDDGTRFPFEYCATIDGLPLVAAIHTEQSDAIKILGVLMRAEPHRTRVQIFVDNHASKPWGKPTVYQRLEQIRSATSDEARSMVRAAADAGEFPETFFCDEVEAWAVSADHKAWLIEHTATWWPYGLDPNGDPSMRW